MKKALVQIGSINKCYHRIAEIGSRFLVKSKLSIFIMALFIMVVFNCCSFSAANKIGLMMPNLELLYHKNTVEAFTASINSLGGEVSVMNARDNENRQIQQARELIDNGIAAIVLCAVNANTAGAIVRYAHKHGIKVIGYDGLIKNCMLDYYVSFDSKKIGQAMAEFAVQQRPTGNYVLFYGDATDHNAHLIKEAQLNTLAPYIRNGDINIQYQSYVDDWSGTNAVVIMQKILDFDSETPDVLLSSYDGMSTACINVFEKYKLDGKIVVTGQNAESEAIQNIRNDKQHLTFKKSGNILAARAAEIAWNMVHQKDKVKWEQTVFNGRMDVPAELLEAEMVTKQNIDRKQMNAGL